MELECPCRESVENVLRVCGSCDDVEVASIHEKQDQAPHQRAGLTETQFDTVRAGLNAGLYEIPRKRDFPALAEDLGISHQALSERCRRAHKRLVENAVSADG